jgi:hypothetical protein
MVTPRAVNSHHCKFEFEAFLACEKALDRTDLVFPPLYIGVPALEDEAQWRKDPVLSIIGTRQYVDWRPFRHLDVRTTPVREAIERFCNKIVEALRKPWISPEERRKQHEIEALQRAEAARLAEEEKPQAEAGQLVEEEKQLAEMVRLADEEKQRADAVRLADEEKQRADAVRLADEEKQRAEAVRLAEEQRRAGRARQASRSLLEAFQGPEQTHTDRLEHHRRRTGIAGVVVGSRSRRGCHFGRGIARIRHFLRARHKINARFGG